MRFIFLTIRIFNRLGTVGRLAAVSSKASWNICYLRCNKTLGKVVPKLIRNSDYLQFSNSEQGLAFCTWRYLLCNWLEKVFYISSEQRNTPRPEPEFTCCKELNGTRYTCKHIELCSPLHVQFSRGVIANDRLSAECLDGSRKIRIAESSWIARTKCQSLAHGFMISVENGMAPWKKICGLVESILRHDKFLSLKEPSSYEGHRTHIHIPGFIWEIDQEIQQGNHVTQRGYGLMKHW